MFFRLFSTVFRHKRIFIMACGCILIHAGASLAPAEWGGHLVKDLLTRSSLSNLLLMGSIALLIFTVKFAVDYGRRFLMNYLGHLISIDLLNNFHKKLLHLPASFFHKFRSGDLLSRTTTDVAVMRGFLGGSMLSIINDPLVIILALTRLFLLNWLFTLELLLIGCGIAVLMHFAGNQLRRAASSVQTSLAELTSRIQESLSSIEVIKVFRREQYHTSRFSEATGHYRKKARRSTAIEAVFRPAVDFLGFIAALLILITGAALIHRKQMAVPDLFTFLFYLGILSAPMNSISHMIAQYKTAAAAAERFYEVLDSAEEESSEELPPLHLINAGIVLEDISFKYQPEHPVLQGINCTFEPGTITALVGPSGSGKTTLCKLLPRLLEPQSGTISVDGTDIMRCSLASVRDQISLLPQHHTLIHASIFENIRYGKPEATVEEVEQAAALAGVCDFLKLLPEGFDTVVSEGKSGLSGGQLQKIALARLILRDTPVWILDEATSALDNTSEQQIRELLLKFRPQKTIIVIAHRLTTAVSADRILVLENGRISEQGTHTDLSNRSGSVYSRLLKAGLENTE